MSQPTAAPARYGPAPAQPPRLPTWARGLIAVVLEALAAPFALLLAFVATVEASGCFLECTDTDPRPALALLYALGAAALLTVGPLAMAALGRSRAWLVASGWTFAGLALVAVCLVGAAS